jgi:hypothetical protein
MFWPFNAIFLWYKVLVITKLISSEFLLKYFGQWVVLSAISLDNQPLVRWITLKSVVSSFS